MDDWLNFRWAEARDFEAVRSLAGQLAIHIDSPIPPMTPERFNDWYVGTDAPMRLLLALGSGRVVGMVAWALTHELYSGEARVYISDISVDRAARGKGVGSALITEVKAWARFHGARKLGWEIWRHNHTAKAFYEKLGAHVDDEAIPYVLTIEDGPTP